MLAGGTHIDHVNMLRAGATGRVLPFKVMAPSTVGTFLRSFTFGHVRQLDAVCSRVLARSWQAGAGPSDEAMVVDLDSTICEVHGKQKQAAAYGYTKVLGYRPLVATPTDDAVLKIFYLAIDNIGHHRGGELGTHTQGWKQALNAFAVAYPGRIPDTLI